MTQVAVSLSLAFVCWPGWGASISYDEPEASGSSVQKPRQISDSRQFGWVDLYTGMTFEEARKTVLKQGYTETSNDGIMAEYTFYWPDRAALVLLKWNDSDRLRSVGVYFPVADLTQGKQKVASYFESLYLRKLQPRSAHEWTVRTYCFDKTVIGEAYDNGKNTVGIAFTLVPTDFAACADVPNPHSPAMILADLPARRPPPPPPPQQVAVRPGGSSRQSDPFEGFLERSLGEKSDLGILARCVSYTTSLRVDSASDRQLYRNAFNDYAMSATVGLLKKDGVALPADGKTRLLDALAAVLPGADAAMKGLQGTTLTLQVGLWHCPERMGAIAEHLQQMSDRLHGKSREVAPQN